PKLFETFSGLERADGQVRVGEQEIALIDIQANVLVVTDLGAAAVRNRGAGEVDRVSQPVRHDFDHIGIVVVGRVLDFPLEGGHRDVRIVEQGEDGGVNGRGIDEGLVALNVDDDGGGVRGGDFGDAVGTREVIVTRHANDSPEGPGSLGDPVVVGGNDDIG